MSREATEILIRSTRSDLITAELYKTYECSREETETFRKIMELCEIPTPESEISVEEEKQTKAYIVGAKLKMDGV